MYVCLSALQSICALMAAAFGRAFVATDTSKRARRALAAATRPDLRVFMNGGHVKVYREGDGWCPGAAVVVAPAGHGHVYIDYGGRVFKHLRSGPDFSATG